MYEYPFMTAVRWIGVILWILGALVILVAFSYVEFISYFEEVKRRIVIKRRAVRRSFLAGVSLVIIGIFVPFLLRSAGPKPKIRAVELLRFPPASFEGGQLIDGPLIQMLGNSEILSEEILFEKSRYEIRLTAKGTQAEGISARLVVLAGDYQLANYLTPLEFKEKTIRYHCRTEGKKRLAIRFVNDLIDEKTGEDRNVWIQSVAVYKIEMVPKDT